MRIRHLALAGALAAFGVGAAVPGPLHTYLFESNLMPVVEGQVYRSAQPSGPELARWVERLGIKSVLNLRGEDNDAAWMREEHSVSASLGITHYDLHLSADRMPPAQKLREVVQILDAAPRPLLLHCKGGVERSGLVGAVAVLLARGDLDAARREFAVSKGYLPFVASSDLPRVIDDYESWLGARGVRSSPERFRDWVEHDYAPDFYRAEIAPLDAPASLAAGAPLVLRFRITNRSVRPIPLRAETGRGVHLGARLRPPEGSGAPAAELRAPGVDRQLAPGESAELALQLPPLAAAGRWRLDVDLVDERVKWFAEMGSPELVLPIEVSSPSAGTASPSADAADLRGQAHGRGLP